MGSLFYYFRSSWCPFRSLMMSTNELRTTGVNQCIQVDSVILTLPVKTSSFIYYLMKSLIPQSCNKVSTFQWHFDKIGFFMHLKDTVQSVRCSLSISDTLVLMCALLQVSASPQVNAVSPWCQPIVRICPLLCDPHRHHRSLMATALHPSHPRCRVVMVMGLLSAHGGHSSHLYRKLLLCSSL